MTSRMPLPTLPVRPNTAIAMLRRRSFHLLPDERGAVVEWIDHLEATVRTQTATVAELRAELERRYTAERSLRARIERLCEDLDRLARRAIGRPRVEGTAA